jgi:hypothetical protein
MLRMSRDEVLSRSKMLFEAEWQSPTSEASGGVIE